MAGVRTGMAVVCLMAVAVLSGCEYPLGHGFPPFDNGGAMSPGYVVGTSVVMKAYPSLYPINYYPQGTGQDLTASQTDVCAIPVNDAPAVIRGVSTNRFYYAATPNEQQFCLTSAPDTAPFAFDRRVFFTNFDLGIPAAYVLDRPFVIVSHDKIVVFINVFDTGQVFQFTSALIINLADYVAGVNSPRHTVIQFASG